MSLTNERDSSSYGSETNKYRAVLTKDQVLEIFRFSLPDISGRKSPSAISLARKYCVSEKAIRDIWTGRTWSQHTQHFNQSQNVKPYRKVGRPLGCRDSVPRKQRGMSASVNTLEEPESSTSRTQQLGNTSTQPYNLIECGDGFIFCCS